MSFECDTTGTLVSACANVNTSPILDADTPWDYVGKGGTRNMPTASFFEGGGDTARRHRERLMTAGQLTGTI